MMKEKSTNHPMPSALGQNRGFGMFSSMLCPMLPGTFLMLDRRFSIFRSALLAALAWLVLSAPAIAQDPDPMPEMADNDRDGLIEIYTLDDLNSIRYSLDGTSYKMSEGSTPVTTGCPMTGMPYDPGDGAEPITSCYGYELMAHLDFDANNDDVVDETDSDGAYWNEGSGWEPIGTLNLPFAATFDGNGYTISNLFINRGSDSEVGLFGALASDGEIRNLGVVDAEVTGNSQVGSLAGINRGNITASYALATVSGINRVGGLVGENAGTVSASYAVAIASGNERVGGLTGINNESIVATYVVATVSGIDSVGGLVGENAGTTTASYAVATVSGTGENVGGLVGENRTADGGTIVASYFKGLA